MKLAVTGKGGVGKTTISALLAPALRQTGFNVTAIDVDPNSSLLACMGFPKPDSVRPLIELKDLIEERTGVKAGTTGGMFRLNPFVGDIPGKYSVDVGGVKVLVAGTVKRGGSGCYCPENTLVRTLVAHLLTGDNAALVMDMEAGLEHLSRGTVEAVDRLLIVVDPGRRSAETALRIRSLAEDIGLKRINAIGNKIRTEREKLFLKQALNGIAFAGFVPYDEKLHDAELEGKPAAGASPAADKAISEIVEYLSR